MHTKIKTIVTVLSIIGLSIFMNSGCEKEEKVDLPELSTLSISEITFTSGKSGGVIIDNGGEEIISRGIVWNTVTNPSVIHNVGIATAKSEEYSDIFECYLIGLYPDTKYFVRAYATNSAGTAYGNEVAFTTPENESAGTVKDIDGNEYMTIKIGAQEWMAENLRTSKYKTNINIKHADLDSLWQETGSNETGAWSWYNNNSTNDDRYGKLYNWHAVNNELGLCPTGWHVPTVNDWAELVNYIKSQNDNFIANQLKSCRQIDSPLGGICDTDIHPRWDSHSIHYGTNDFLFSGTPGGYRISTGSFFSKGYEGVWWSASENSEENAWSWSLHNSSGDISENNSNKQDGYSVRCVKYP